MPTQGSPVSGPRNSRLPVSLSPALDHKLLGYAVAATAAGVGALAISLPADAEIVYTPAHQKIPPKGSTRIDLNHDGTVDFTVNNGFSTNCSFGRCNFASLTITPNAGNRVWITYGGNSFAWALSADRKVGPGDNFGSRSPRMERCVGTATSFRTTGSWGNVKEKYVGLEFSVDGETYYGWARFNVSLNYGRCQLTALLTGYAYENVAGRPIPTGKTSGEAAVEANETEHATSSLGGLALGSVVRYARREEDDVK
ncbi:MAG TPA: hypothetical protein VND65_10010 [Candidatus Binatia bacterium]|nr:hypothetical protein [Candidatus Binatia bacterium]